jgi:tetratricopeptide (TPR) repeat protein
MRVLWGRCYEYERVLPYQPFAEALRNGIEGSPTVAVGGDIRASSGADGTRAASDAAALSALPSIWQQALLLLLPDWAGRLHPAPVALTQRPGEEQSQLLEAISQLLSALARRHPVLLVIDDLHWAADSTLQLFHHLARGVSRQPILLVGSFRPEDLAPATPRAQASLPPLLRMGRSLQAEGVLDLVNLPPLDRDQVVELVEHLAGARPNARRSGPGQVDRSRLAVLAEGLHRYTEGNPLFVLAAVESLRDAGMIRELPEPAGASVQLTGTLVVPSGLHEPSSGHPPDGGLTLPLPPRIRALLEERLDRVQPAAREVARLAAVAGSEFDLAVLERAWGKGEDETLQAVDTLLGARFFREGGARGARDFSFTHHLLKEATYEALPKAARARHHRRIAEAMEAAYGTRALASELALHYARGEVPLQALRYARIAGDQAAASYANDDALNYYTQALGVLAEAREAAAPDAQRSLDVQRIDLLDARLALYRRLGRPREEEADVAAMLDAARAVGDRQREVLALIHRSSLESRAANGAQSLASARGAVALVQGLLETGIQSDIYADLEARAQASLGRAYLLLDHYADSLAAYRQALAGYRALKSATAGRDSAASGEAVTLYNIGWVHEHTGDYAEAQRCYEEALSIYRTLGDRLGEANTRVYLGNICWFLGDLRGAQAHYEAAQSLFEQIVYRRGEAACLRNLGLTLWRRGRLEDALEYHRRALALHEALEAPAGVAESHQSIADIHYRTGRYAEALDGYERALALTRDAGSRLGEALSLLGCARVERAKGQYGQAMARIEAARPICAAIGDRLGMAWCDREAGLAELDLGHTDVARTLLRAALDGFTALSEPSMRTATTADLARAELALGRVAEALVLAREAAAAIDAGDHGVDQPQAVLLTLAQVLQAVGDGAGAREAFAAAAADVRAQADRLRDADLRASFLERVPVNGAIARAVTRRAGARNTAR